MQFARSVKMVQTKVVANQVNEKGVEAQLRREIEELRKQLSAEGDGEPDAQVQQILEEQETICKYWGKDWESVLQEARQKMNNRLSTMSHNMPQVTEVALSAQSAAIAEDDEDNQSDVSEAEAKAQCALVYLSHDPSAVATRASIRVRLPDALSLTGPAAMTAMKERADEMIQRARQNSKKLHELMEEAKRAEALCASLSRSASSPLRLRVATATSMVVNEASAELPGDVLVDIVIVATSSTDTEWLSVEDFRKRAAWLHEQQAAGAAALDDPWLKATASTGALRGGASGSSAPAPSPAQEPTSAELVARALEGARADHQRALAELRASLEQERQLALASAKNEREQALASLRAALEEERRRSAEHSAGASQAAQEQALAGLRAGHEREASTLRGQVAELQIQVQALKPLLEVAERRADDAEYQMHAREMDMLSHARDAAMLPRASNASSVGQSLTECFERALGAIAGAQIALEEVNRDLRSRPADVAAARAVSLAPVSPAGPRMQRPSQLHALGAAAFSTQASPRGSTAAVSVETAPAAKATSPRPSMRLTPPSGGVPAKDTTFAPAVRLSPQPAAAPAHAVPAKASTVVAVPMQEEDEDEFM